MGQEATIRRLIVDPARHARELERFAGFVVRGPEPTDCWIWTGAIADDGYGRFWLGRPDGPRVVRAHRFAAAAAAGSIASDEIAMHSGCDNPICVRAHSLGDAEGRPHVWIGTQTENLHDMVRKGRGAVPWLRQSDRRARSVALRTAVRDGWDAARVRQAVADTAGAGTLALFDLAPVITIDPAITIDDGNDGR